MQYSGITLKTFREKENHSNGVQCFFFALGVYFIYRSDLRRSFLSLKKCEIIQIVLLSIFNREK